MSPTSGNLPRAVRTGPSQRVRIGLCAAVFVAVGLAILGLGEKRADRDAGFVAKATVWLPLADAERIATRSVGQGTPLSVAAIRDEITSQDTLRRATARMGAPPDARGADRRAATEDPEARRLLQGLEVTAMEDSPSGTYRVSMAGAGQDLESCTKWVNALAEQYADDCRERLAGQLRRTAEEASRAAQAARDEYAQLKRQGDAFLETHFRGLKPPVQRPCIDPETPAVQQVGPSGIAENPDWTEQNRELEALRRYRQTLLEDRTPLHPEVQKVDLQIARVRRQLETIPREVTGRTTAPPPAGPSVVREGPAPSRGRASGVEESEEYAKAVRAFETQQRQLQAASERTERLAAREREAWEATLKLPRIETRLAVCPEVRRPSGPSSRWPLLALLAAVAAAGGVGLVSHGMSIDPPLRSQADVQSSLPIPLVATIEAAPSERSSEAPTPRSAEGSLWIVLGVLVMGVCALIVFRAGGWL